MALSLSKRCILSAIAKVRRPATSDMLIAQTLETPRLLLRPEELSDAEGLYRMQTDPEVMRFIGDGRIVNWSIEDYRRAITQCLPSDHGNLTILCQTDRGYLGWCGLP